jgi:hypothetical protein
MKRIFVDKSRAEIDFPGISLIFASRRYELKSSWWNCMVWYHPMTLICVGDQTYNATTAALLKPYVPRAYFRYKAICCNVFPIQLYITMSALSYVHTTLCPQRPSHKVVTWLSSFYAWYSQSSNRKHPDNLSIVDDRRCDLWSDLPDIVKRNGFTKTSIYIYFFLFPKFTRRTF